MGLTRMSPVVSSASQVGYGIGVEVGDGNDGQEEKRR